MYFSQFYVNYFGWPLTRMLLLVFNLVVHLFVIALDEELKQLQLTSSELAESNSLLRQHVDDLKANVKAMEEDIGEQQAKNEVLRSHLDSVKTELVAVLRSFPLSNFPHALDTSNVESYLRELKLLWQKEPEQYELIVRRVKDIILGSSRTI